MSFPNLAQALEETFNTSLCINICMVKHSGLIFHDLTATATATFSSAVHPSIG